MSHMHDARNNPIVSDAEYIFWHRESKDWFNGGATVLSVSPDWGDATVFKGREVPAHKKWKGVYVLVRLDDAEMIRELSVAKA